MSGLITSRSLAKKYIVNDLTYLASIRMMPPNYGNNRLLSWSCAMIKRFKKYPRTSQVSIVVALARIREYTRKLMWLTPEEE